MQENTNKVRDFVNFLMFFVWLFIGASIIIIPMFILGPIITNTTYEEFNSNQELITKLTYISATISHTLGIVLFVILYKNIIKNDSKSFKDNWWKNIIMIILGIVLLYTSNILITKIYDALGYGGQTSNNQQSIIEALNGSSKPFVLIYTIILAPIFEEIVFRKLFFTTLKNYTKLPVWAIVLIISAVFAFIHVSDVESLVFFPQYFILALIITTAYAISKENILVSVGLHFLNNVVAVIEILI